MVWAPRGGEPAFKQPHYGREGSLENDFTMHKQITRALHILRKMKTLNYEDEKLPQVQISECYRYIKPTDQEWWRANLGVFTDEFTPCNLIKSQRIFPFSDATDYLLEKSYCPPGTTQFYIMTNRKDKDCLIRPYPDRRRSEKAPEEPQRERVHDEKLPTSRR